MDFMLEEELMDLMMYCIQNDSAPDLNAKRTRITKIGHQIHEDGGVDAMEAFFFALENRIRGEIDANAAPFRSLWNGIDQQWKY